MKRIVVLLACLAGCLEHKVCNLGAPADFEYRDPSTGKCQSFGTPCDSACGPCPAVEQPQPDWAPCFGPCEQLGETSCLATANCHAAYSDDPTPQPVFLACWELPPSGAIHGACIGLDAQTCSEHDDCASLYTGPVNQPQNFSPSFERCIAKPGAQPACASLAGEAACVARADCDPIYDGSNCTCDKNGCTCQTETYVRCQ